MNRVVKLFWALVMVSGAALAQDAVTPVPEQHEWSFSTQGSMPLKDGWFVYRDQLLNPVILSGQRCGAGTSAQSIDAPDIWGPGFTLSVSSGHGVATYCRQIQLPDEDDAFAFRMGTLRSVSHIFAVTTSVDGSPVSHLLYKNGNLGAHADQIVNNPGIPVVTLPYGLRDFTLVMQLSNRIHKQGGMIEVPLLDYRWRLAAMENRATALPGALVIVLIFVGIAALVLGRQKSLSSGHIYFGFLSFAAAIRAAFVSDLVWDYFPAFSLARKYDLEYLSLFLIAVAYYGFINDLLRPGKRMIVDYAIYAVSAILIVFALFVAPFFPPGTITLTREPVQILWGSIILASVYTVFQATIKNPETRHEAIIVSVAALTYAAYEIASVSGLIGSSLEWSQFIIFVVMMMHAHAFVTQAGRTERERDALMASLEDANRDLTNRAFALDVALKKAEQASNAKSHFLATVSHELRTPLNAIIGFSELMSRELLGKLGNRLYLEYAKDILASGNHLLGLVDDILDLSRIESGEDELKAEPVDLEQLVREAANILRIQADQQDVSVRVECEKYLPYLLGDERKIRQIFLNLISNAIKFNVERGRVWVTLRTKGQSLHIEVEDTGLGIAESELPHIMSRLGPSDSERRQQKSGVGIGLPLSEVFVHQHGGAMSISSKLGEGTTISIEFPSDRLVPHPRREFVT